MDGILRRGSRPDPVVQDALYQRQKKRWNDLLKQKDRMTKLAWRCCAASNVLAGLAIGGCIYLGTLPKKDVEYLALDPLGYSMRMYTRDITEGERDQFRRTAIANFIKNYRETYPFSKEKQERAIMAAIKMTNANTPAAKEGAKYFDETKPYERAKKEAVSVDVTEINRIGDGGDTWHVKFTETVRDLRSLQTKDTEWAGSVTTETLNDFAAKRRTPLGFFVKDFNFQPVDGK